VAACALALAVAAPAQDAPDDPLLASLIEEALQHHPELQAAQAGVSAAQARPEQARALPDPMLLLDYTNDGWAFSLGREPMTTLELMVSQQLPWPGKRDLRGRIAQSEVGLAAAQVERARLGLEARVRRAYTELRLARQSLTLVAEQEEALRSIEGVTRARYAVGQGAQQDVVRIQIEVTRIQQQRLERTLQEQVALAELNQLLTRAADTPLSSEAPLALEPEPRPEAALLEDASGLSPELAAAAASVERERLAVDLARRDFKPDLAVQGGYMNRGSLPPMWRAGAGIELPVQRGRRRAALAEAEARLQGAQRRLESLKLLLRFRTQERVSRLRSIEEEARLFERGVIPQDELSVQSAVASYQAGTVPFISVLEAHSSLYRDRAAHLRLLATHEATRAGLAEISLEAPGAMPAAATGPTLGGGGMSAGPASASMDPQ
jgi:outer membrane protein TolC